MLYLAIDQHRKQLTVNLRNEAGDVILKRQVSTEWKRVREFFENLQNQIAPEEGFVAIVEVCGFNDWLLKLLAEYGCRETVLVQPERRTRHKTDRRDSNSLGELLWTNRHRLLAGKKVQNVRRVVPPSQRDAEDRHRRGSKRGQRLAGNVPWYTSFGVLPPSHVCGRIRGCCTSNRHVFRTEVAFPTLPDATYREHQFCGFDADCGNERRFMPLSGK